LGVEEQIGVAALDRPRAERFNVLVERRTDPADVALRDPQPKPLDQLVDPAGRNAAHIRLLHHRQQRLLGPLPGLQEARKVAALAQLRDLQLQLAGPGVPAPGPVAIAVRRPILRTALPALRANQLGHLELHHLGGHGLDRLADHIGVLVAQYLTDDLFDRHPLRTGHRWCLLSSTPWNEPTMLSTTVAGTTSPSDRHLHQR